MRLQFLLSIVILAPLSRAAEEDELTLHLDVEPLKFCSPRHAAQSQNGRFGAVDKGVYRISSGEGKNWIDQSKIPAGLGPDHFPSIQI